MMFFCTNQVSKTGCVFIYSLIVVDVHAIFQEYILDKISKKLHLSKSKLAIFNNSGQLLVFYLISVLWGIDTIMRERYLPEISRLWTEYPAPITFLAKLYFIIQLAYSLHELPELYLQRVKREEYLGKAVSSIAALVLVSISYFLRNPDSVGFRVWVPDLALKICGRFPDHWAIMTAKMYIIGRAVHVISRKISKVVIVSDSLSALEKLKGGNHSAITDIITVKVINALQHVKELGFHIAGIWVPTHPYILHDTAGILANRGRLLPEPAQIKGGPQELWPEHNKSLWNDWNMSFAKSVR
ncbi:hypothetical protein HHI36_019380 [Cryptolaemus montrouzieri]|uniref:TLC domain-containing protein n=1 Tax=Cryptolaemus montrouzieri TaxID=559131 RepID=A0ABD2P399_9CUCU